MNRIAAASIAIAIAAFAGIASADDITIESQPVVQGTSAKTRAQVTAEFLASRKEAAAFTGEDSGSAWIAAHGRQAAAPVLAGQPVKNAQ